MPEPPKPKRSLERFTGLFKGLVKPKNPKHIIDTTGFDTVRVLDSFIENNDGLRRAHNIEGPGLNGLIVNTHMIAEYLVNIKTEARKLGIDFDLDNLDVTKLTIQTEDGSKQIKFSDFFRLILHGELDVIQYFSEENQIIISTIRDVLELCQTNHGLIPNFQRLISHFVSRKRLVKTISSQNQMQKYNTLKDYLAQIIKDTNLINSLNSLYNSLNTEERNILIKTMSEYIENVKLIINSSIQEIITKANRRIKLRQDRQKEDETTKLRSVSFDDAPEQLIRLDQKFDSEVMRAIPDERIANAIKQYTPEQKAKLMELFIFARGKNSIDKFWTTIKTYYTNPGRVISILESILQ